MACRFSGRSRAEKPPSARTKPSPMRATQSSSRQRLAQFRGDGLAQARREPIDFAHQNGQRGVTAAATRQFRIQPLKQSAPVGQAGQRYPRRPTGRRARARAHAPPPKQACRGWPAEFADPRCQRRPAPRDRGSTRRSLRRPIRGARPARNAGRGRRHHGIGPRIAIEHRPARRGSHSGRSLAHGMSIEPKSWAFCP